MRSEQAEEALLLGIETDISCAHDSQMPRPKILDRSSVEILVDDRGTDV
jgi:hypothetical protein